MTQNTDQMLDELLGQTTLRELLADTKVSTVRGGKPRQRKYAPRGSQFRIEPYIPILEWTEKARYTTVEQVAIYTNTDEKTARRRLENLMRQGYVAKKKHPGYPMVYHLTALGKDEIGSDTQPPKTSTGSGFVPHTLLVGWTMLSLLTQRQPITKWAEVIAGRSLTLDDFVSEPEIERAANKKWGQVMTRLEKEADRRNGRTFVPDWRGWDAMALELASVRGDKQRFYGNKEDKWAWALMGGPHRTHYPDLVLAVWGERGEGAIAFEIERHNKPESVQGIVDAYTSSFEEHFLQPPMKIRELLDNPQFEKGEHETIREHEAKKQVEVYNSRRTERDTAVYTNVHWITDSRLVETKLEEVLPENHFIVAANALLNWVDDYRARLAAEQAEAQAENQRARAQELWHLTSAGDVARCKCGARCQAKYGNGYIEDIEEKADVIRRRLAA